MIQGLPCAIDMYLADPEIPCYIEPEDS